MKCQWFFFSIILITIIFWLLDNRNRELIKISEKGFCTFEKDQFKKDEKFSYKIFRKEERQSCVNCFRHTLCFKLLYFIAAVSALIIIYTDGHIQCKMSYLRDHNNNSIMYIYKNFKNNSVDVPWS